MKKLLKPVIFIIVIIICTVSAYKIGAKGKNEIKTPTDNAIGRKNIDESKLPGKDKNLKEKRIYLEPIAEKLNKKENKLNLYKDFSTYVTYYAPLYTLTKDYEGSIKTDTGEILAGTKYVQGTYKIKDDLLVEVLIIQDKTFENGGLIYINDTMTNYVIYKYKETYLLFKHNYDISDLKKNKNTSDFIKEFYNEYSKLYEIATQP